MITNNVTNKKKICYKKLIKFNFGFLLHRSLLCTIIFFHFFTLPLTSIVCALQLFALQNLCTSFTDYTDSLTHTHTRTQLPNNNKTVLHIRNWYNDFIIST